MAECGPTSLPASVEQAPPSIEPGVGRRTHRIVYVLEAGVSPAAE